MGFCPNAATENRKPKRRRYVFMALEPRFKGKV